MLRRQLGLADEVAQRAGLAETAHAGGWECHVTQCRLSAAMDLADRGHAAMAERFRLGAEADGGEALESPDGLLFAGRTDFPVMMNGAIPYAGGGPRALVSRGPEGVSDPGPGFPGLAP